MSVEQGKRVICEGQEVTVGARCPHAHSTPSVIVTRDDGSMICVRVRDLEDCG